MASGNGAHTEGCQSAVGGLMVLTGYGEERLGYLATILSESLPRALWSLPPEFPESERELGLAHAHLRSGTSVVQIAVTDDEVSRFRGLAEKTRARFLLVEVLPPHSPGEDAELDLDCPQGPGVRLQTSASLPTQLGMVLEAWKRLSV